MSSNDPEANDVIDVEEAAKRLGITPLFLRWSLDAGLPLVIQGKHGRWSLTLGQSNGHPLVPGAEEVDTSMPQSHPEGMAQEAAAAQKPVEIAGDTAVQATGATAPEAEDIPETEQEIPHAPPSPEPAEEPAPVSPASESASGPEANAAHLLDEVTFLRQQVEFHSRISAEKDRLIADLSLRLGQLGEETVKHVLGEPSNPSKADSGTGSFGATGPAAAQRHPSSDQLEINARHEQAIRSIRDTLILVRNYLSQLDDRFTFNGGDKA